MSKVRRKQHLDRGLDAMCQALDAMISGANSVIGRDFIMERRHPINADIGHLDPKVLNTFDQAFVDELIHIKTAEPLVIPKRLNALSEAYRQERERLTAYYQTTVDFMLEHDTQAGKELGNFDPYLQKVVIRNDAERNMFSDYIFLYRKINKRRAISHWIHLHPSDITPENKAVVSALEKARFSVLRLDKNLDHGAIQATETITQKTFLLIDRALNASRKEGLFFICSLLDRGEYAMTSGGGIPIDPRCAAGKSVLSLLKPHLEKLRRTQRACTKDIMACVTQVYGLCLRGGAMSGMNIR